MTNLVQICVYTVFVKPDFFARLIILVLSSIYFLGPWPLAAHKIVTTAPASDSQSGRSDHNPSAEEIADAKAKGLVWVNTATRVFHKEGPAYGTTSLGRFMTEEAAKKAGYRAASESGNRKGTRASSPDNK